MRLTSYSPREFLHCCRSATKRLFVFIGLCTMVALFTPQVQGQINFSSSGLAGESLNNPTSLQFGPDGRLYVSQQNGLIFAYTIVRNGPSDYAVTATETINLVQQVQNHDDDGSLHGTVKRQVTGLLVVGTAANPILYVSSSDYRIGGGGGGSDKGLDTNSGLISRLTKSGGSWARVDLVRGLPRSEENHASNGMQLDTVNNILYLAQGGHTNAGAPSNNFAFTTEYALSASVLSIDLDVIDAMTVQFDAANNANYVYDIPTTDDPTRANINGITDPLLPGYDGIDVGDPFGGNDGLNQAKQVLGGPVQVYASGFRNAYDVALTQAGRLYTWDNGANAGWGGHPDNEGGGSATNNWVTGEPGSTGPGPNDAKVNNLDGLHFITGSGYYGGHPAPIRANPAAAGLFTHDHANGAGGANGVWRTQVIANPDSTLPVDWPPVPLSLADPQQGDFQNAGVDDLTLFTVPASTNGLAEYTGSNFSGAMQGNLLAASFNGNIYRVNLNAAGSINGPGDVTVLASGFGSSPLDLTTLGDGDPFPGTIWAATYGSDNITVFEPQDFTTCFGTYSTTLDEDNDGFTNADEIDNGTDPCNGGDKPNDFDGTLIGGFKVSDLNDPDDDDDGINDTLDYFALDASNGLNTPLPLDFPLLNGDPGTGLYGLGFTGFMVNGTNDYLDLLKDENNSYTEIIAGGAVGLLTFNEVQDGTAKQGINTQKNAFQFGLPITDNTPPLVIEAAMLGPFYQNTPQGDQGAGFYIGNGDQDNYVKIGVTANNGSPMVEVMHEIAGAGTPQLYSFPGVELAAELKLFLQLDPIAGTVQPQIDMGTGVQNVGSQLTLSGTLLATVQGNDAVAVGVMCTSANADSLYSATWDYIRADFSANTALGQWSYVNDGSNCAAMGSPGSCPQGRHEASYVQVGDKFILIGGRENGSNVNIYDPATDTWTVGASPGFSIHHFQAVAYEGLLYMIGAMTGGFPNETGLPNIQIYDPMSDEWILGPAIPNDRIRGSAGVVVRDDKFYVVSGIVNGHTSGWVPWFDVFDPATNAWDTLPDAPRSRDHFHAAIVNDQLVMAAGRRSGEDGTFNGTEGLVDVFDFNLGTWSTLANSIPTERAGNTVAVLGREVIVIGGERESGSAKDATEALDIITGTWRTLDNLNTGRHGSQAIVNNGGIYLASGSPNRGGGNVPSQESFFFGANTTPQLQAMTQSTLTASASGFDFGSVQAGNSDTETLTLTNTGGNQGIIVEAVVFGNGAFLTATPSQSLPYHLSPGQSMTIDITYAPTNTNALADNLIISHSGSTNSTIITLGSNSTAFSGVFINCGGPQYTAANTNVFEADVHFNNGNTYSQNNSISGTTDPTLYQTERYNGALGYSIPIQNGDYEVDLHFAEIWSGGFSVGARVFDVFLEGNLVLDDYDIFADVGSNTAVIKTFPVTITDGALDLTSQASVNNMKLSAIAVRVVNVTPGQLAVTPTTYHYQATPLTTTSDFTFAADNAGGATVTIDSVRLSGPEAAVFSTTLVDGTTLTGGSNQNFDISFTPNSLTPSVQNATLLIYHDAAGSTSPIQITLSGEPNCAPQGTACDDNDPSTFSDVEDGNCNCAGTPCPPAGTACNDNDYSTFNDIEDGNCNCAGTPCPTAGTTCDDNNPSTFNDVEDGNCNCAGTPCPPAGTACDDNDPSTTNDIEDGNCNCAGTPCPVAGTTCDDNDPSTFNDVEDGNCGCAGTPCPPAGTACDDNDPSTTNDIEDGNCNCAGTPCPPAGTACDDNDPSTTNDIEDGNCNCAGTPCPVAGTTCDDNDPSTFNDVEDGNCGCAGTPCPPAGTACDDNDPSTTNDIEDGNCNCAGTPCPVAGTTCDDNDPSTFNDVEDGNCGCAGTPCPVAGTTCDDNDPSTFNDVEDGNCGCAGTPCPVAGTTCDDNDPSTFNDVEDGNCGCAGTPCPVAGTTCDDNDPSTFNDVEDGNCNCAGTPCPVAGTTCDDNDPSTFNDVEDGNCGCAGTPCPTAGTTCDDNDPSTFNDVEDGNCGCAGTPCPVAGTTCDDNDPSTFNDVEDGNCNCAGTPCPVAGTACNDNDPNTINDVEDGNCNCAGTLPCVIIDTEGFESGLGIWTLGGADAFLSTLNPNTGVNSINLQDNTNTSTLTTGDLNLASYPTVKVRFSYYPVGFNNGSEDFWLQVSTDGGATYSTYEEWNLTDEFVNNSRYNEEVTIVGITMTANTRIRFRCDASGNGDDLFLDDIEIEGCNICAPVNTPCDDQDPSTYNDLEDGLCNCFGTPCPTAGTACDDGNPNTANDVEDGNCNCAGVSTCTTVDFTDFESGLGIWIDGGADCYPSTLYPNSGTQSVGLQDNTSTSVLTTGNMDFSGTSEVTVSFSYYVVSFEGVEDFWLQVSTDGGTTFTTVEEWNRTDEFENDIRYNESVRIPALPFSATTQFRFRADASGNADDVYLDDIRIEDCGTCPTAGTACDDGDSNTINDVEDGNCGCAGTPSSGSKRAVPEPELSSELFTDFKVFPNPFQTVTRFEFTTTETTLVSLELFTLNGQKLTDVFREVVPAGKKQEIDFSGEGLSEGIYMYRLSTEGGGATYGKLVIQR